MVAQVDRLAHDLARVHDAPSRLRSAIAPFRLFTLPRHGPLREHLLTCARTRRNPINDGIDWLFAVLLGLVVMRRQSVPWR